MPEDKLVECVPNFSEGRNMAVIKEIVRNIPECGCQLLDIESDPSHNRTVVTYIGSPANVAEAAFACAKAAAGLINMERHTGQHPRIGAIDVIPFIPIQGVTMDECVEMARRLGERIGRELCIPVYLYAKAATRPDRLRLPDIRKGEYEGLKIAIRTDPARAPDFGPLHLHPTAGATAVGARPPLIAFNVNLDTGDIVKARTIARSIRESSGGFPEVQAKGILIKETGDVQVTMNLLDYKRTSMNLVMSEIERLSKSLGAPIKSSEIVGLVPLDALLEVAVSRLGLRNFQRRQILDLVAQSAKGSSPEARDRSDGGHLEGTAARDEGAHRGQPSGESSALKDNKEVFHLSDLDLAQFIDDLAAPTGAPGGGAASAVAGALGCALIRMVAGNTLSKARFTEGRERLEEIRKASQGLMEEFQKLAQRDTDAYLQVESAMKMPKSTDEEKLSRREAMQEAFKAASSVPLDSVDASVKALGLIPDLLKYGNPNAITDVGVGALMLDSCRRGATMNVQVNLGSIRDESFVESAKRRLEDARKLAAGPMDAIQDAMRSAGLSF